MSMPRSDQLPRRLAILFAVAVLSGCAAQPEQLRPTALETPIVQKLSVGSGTNAYVIMGTRPILIDTGWGNRTDELEKALAAIAVAPRDLQLIVLTHGHGDHAGGALRMRELSGAKVVVGAGDVEMLAAGHNRPLRPMGALGKLLRGFSDKPFPPLTADIVLTNELDLRPFGVAGKVIPVPGHTPGSLAIVLETGDAVVGDMLRGGTVSTHAPARHFFHDDCLAAEAHIAPLVQAGVKRFYVGHGGPVDAQQARDYFSHESCPPSH